MLRSRLPQIAVEIQVVVEQALEFGAETVAEDARERVRPHRLTGRLEEAIHIDTQREGVYVVAGGKAEEGDDVFWGHLLEHGTSHSAPHPFLVPALDDNRGDVVARVQASLRRL